MDTTAWINVAQITWMTRWHCDITVFSNPPQWRSRAPTPVRLFYSPSHLCCGLSFGPCQKYLGPHSKNITGNKHTSQTRWSLANLLIWLWQSHAFWPLWNNYSRRPTNRMERCTHCKQSYRNHAGFPPSPWPLFPPIAPCFSPGKFSPAATSAAQWLRRSWSSGTAPGPSGPWWGLRWDGEQEKIQGKCWWGGRMQMFLRRGASFPLDWTCNERLELGWLETQECVFLLLNMCCVCVCICVPSVIID